MAAIGLSTYRWNNNLKSLLLLAGFPFLLLLLLAALAYCFAWVYVEPAGNIDPAMFRDFGLEPMVARPGPLDFAASLIVAYWPLVVGAAALWVTAAYLFNDALIRAATGAQPLDRAGAPRVYNIMENLCISRGLKTPRLYIIDDPALNAFASGLDERSYSITVTRGLLEQLNDTELEAVLGHELTHIINRDVRLMIVTVVFVGMISFIAQMLWRSLQFRSNRRERGNTGVAVLIAAIAAAVGYLLALLLRFALSRKREYLADAGSLELTKNPEALISALRKIAERPQVADVPSEVRQMFIENPQSEFFGLFATHPPIEARIRVLEQLGGVKPAQKSIIPPSGPPTRHDIDSLPR